MRVRQIQPPRLRGDHEQEDQGLRPQHRARVEIGSLPHRGLEDADDGGKDGVEAEVERVEVQKHGERQPKVHCKLISVPIELCDLYGLRTVTGLL